MVKLTKDNEREFKSCEVCGKLFHYTDLEDSTCKMCQKDSYGDTMVDDDNVIKIGDVVEIANPQNQVFMRVTGISFEDSYEGVLTGNLEDGSTISVHAVQVLRKV